jgi:hypothetical protein
MGCNIIRIRNKKQLTMSRYRKVLQDRNRFGSLCYRRSKGETLLSDG